MKREMVLLEILFPVISTTCISYCEKDCKSLIFCLDKITPYPLIFCLLNMRSTCSKKSYYRTKQNAGRTLMMHITTKVFKSATSNYQMKIVVIARLNL